MFSFVCPHCNWEIPLGQNSQIAKCPSCSKLVNPPAPPTQAPKVMHFLRKKAQKSQKSFIPPLIIIVVVSLIVVFTVVLTIAVIGSSVRQDAQLQICTNNLKMLGLAMQTYHDSNLCFPLASVPVGSPRSPRPDYYHIEVSPKHPTYPPSSKPTPHSLQSWRVSLLPWYGSDEEKATIYYQLDLDEPWDSEHNLTVAEHMPEILQCPADEAGYKEINGHMIPLTNYVMVTGEWQYEDTTIHPSHRISNPLFWAVGSGESLLQIRSDGSRWGCSHILDGTSNTIMFVEVHGENRPAWVEPIDITLEDFQRGINAETGMCIGSEHKKSGVGNGANMVGCDGHVVFVPDPTDPRDLTAWAGKDDGLPNHLPFK